MSPDFSVTHVPGPYTTRAEQSDQPERAQLSWLVSLAAVARARLSCPFDGFAVREGSRDLMWRYTRWVSIVMLVPLFCWSCSVSNPFVVINESASDVQVTYVKKPFGEQPAAGMDYFALDAPALQTVSGIRDWSRDWQPLDRERAGYDDATGTFKLTLKPEYGVRVADVTNYFGHDQDDLQVRIGELQLTGKNGTIRLEGEQVRKQFVERKRIYELVYR
jgi:hypothetical protein